MRRVPPLLRLALATTLAFLPLAALPGAGAAEGRRSPARASLVAERGAVVAGAKATVGVRLEMDPGWHVYWRNPGDSGVPPTVRWTLPEGVKAGEPRWPAPRRVMAGGLVGFIHEDDLLLPVEIEIPEGYAADTVPLRAEVTWLVCTDICLDGGATVTLDLPVAKEAGAPDPRWKDLFARTRAALPRDPPAGALRARRDGDRVVLDAGGEAAGVDVAPVYFPEDDATIEMAAPQEVVRGDGRWTLRLRPAPRRVAPVERLRGVLAWDTAEGRRAWTVDVEVEQPPADGGGNPK